MKIPNTVWVPGKSLMESHTTFATFLHFVYFVVNVRFILAALLTYDLVVTLIVILTTPATAITSVI